MVDGEVVEGGARGPSEAVKQKKLFQSWCVTWLTECYRVLRPGGVIKVFGATRMMHRMAAAMEEAGFVLQPEHSLEGWGYGSGFPKSLSVSKALDKAAGAEREVVGTSRGVAVADHQGFGGIARGAVGVKQVAADIPVTAPATPEAVLFEGFGTALKPAWEPFLVGKKALVPAK
jgi:site-specific DNA-methyltransferase (adenine-specific)